MKHFLTPEIKGNKMYAKLPRGISKVFTCFITFSKNPNQRPNYEARLELGHDFRIENGYIVSRNIELFSGELYILIEEKEQGKTCKTCRKDDQSGSFCSHCGSFLF